MELPQIRPGAVHEGQPAARIVAFFYNTAHGNSVIQLLTAMGIRNDQLGVTPPERIETGQGMILSIPCPSEAMVTKVEALCRSHGRRSIVNVADRSKVEPVEEFPMRRTLMISMMVFIPGGLAGSAKALERDDVPAFAREIPPTAETKPIFAFNGKDLTGFYPYTHQHGYADPARVFTVHDGMLHISGEDLGGVATCGNFSNYHLIAEWKWGTKTWGGRTKASRDSGILLHCVGSDGAVGGHWMESIECQIIEGGCGDLLVVPGQGKPSLTCETRVGPDKQLYYQKGGTPVTIKGGRFNWWGRDPSWTDTLGIRGKNDVEKPTGEWNRMEVICDGDKITNIVNGYVVNVGTKSSLTEGKLQFQSEGAELFFRKIEIRPLRASPN